MPRPLTTEEWVKRAKARWKGIKKFDYSKVVYVNLKARVLIGCPDCKDFISMVPRNHIRSDRKNRKNHGCPVCGDRQQTIEQVLKDFHKVHGDRYDYSKVNFTKARKYITVICRKHGPFSLTSASHKRGRGCRKCYDESQPIDFQNKRFGKLTVTGKATKKEIESKGIKNTRGHAYWWVQCACGREPFLRKSGDFTSKNRDQSIFACSICSHLKRGLREREESTSKILNKEFGFLYVLREWGSTKDQTSKVICQCICGNTPIVSSSSLKQGRTKSCGCLPKGGDVADFYIKNPLFAKRESILYYVEVGKKYHKFGISFNLKKRSSGDYTKVFYERILERAKARGVEMVAQQWTKDKIPELSKEWLEWEGYTELREPLDINDSINILETLADETEDMTWQEFYKKYNIWPV
tara:strand:+ start:2297 stop:3526 length:1230 start_codon:yes stop_codon:yes gene_type:complete